MRVLILILLIILLQGVSHAQNVNQIEFISLDGPHSQIDHLNDTANDIFLDNPDSAHAIAAKALLLSKKYKYAFGEGNSFLNLGIIYWSQSYYPISLYYFKSAIANLPKNKPLYISDAYAYLGRAYSDLKNDDKAVNYLDTAMYFAGNDAGRQSNVYFEKAYVCYREKKYNEELVFLNYSFKLDKIIHEKNISILYDFLADAYFHKNDFKTAFAYADTSLGLSFKTHNRRLRAFIYADYASMYNKLGKFNTAISYAKKGVLLSDSLGVIDAVDQSYNALVNSYELQNDFKKVFYYQKKLNLARDSLNTIAKLNTVKLVQNYYDLQSKINDAVVIEQKGRDNEAKIKEQHVLIVGLTLSLILMTIILSAIYYFYKQKKSLNDKLQQQHKSLSDQKELIEVQKFNLQTVNNFKDKLLTVIGHDLRAPVRNLTNIVEMFETGYLDANEVNELMKEINPIVKGTELTLVNLLEWAGSQIKGRTIKSSNVDVFLLGVEMEQTFSHALHLKKIQFINKAYPGQRVFADENHLKIILRNLISNAIKFTSQKGMITFFTIVENSEIIVGVEDTGKGMTGEEVKRLFDVGTHFSNSGTLGEMGTGIGLLLCKELIEFNGSTLEVESTLYKGSKFYFRLPLVKVYA